MKNGTQEKATPKGATNNVAHTPRTKKGWMLIPCYGEAHQNPFIDNCMACAPRWGEIEVHERSYKLGQNEMMGKAAKRDAEHRRTIAVLLEAAKLGVQLFWANATEDQKVEFRANFPNHKINNVEKAIAQAEGR